LKIKAIALVLLIFLCIGSVYGCIDNAPPNGINTGTTQKIESKATEDQQSIYVKAQEIPKLDSSLERANLIKRLKWLNAADKLVYVALLSNDGKILGTYTTHKVSSVNSLLTTPQQIVQDPFSHDGNYAGGDQGLVVDSPDIDGSYGDNGDGIFFFTTKEEYVEWNGLYLEQSTPFVLITPPVITKQS